MEAYRAAKGSRNQTGDESRKEKQKMYRRKQIKLHETKFYRKKSYRMSNTTKTEVVTDMSLGNMDKRKTMQKKEEA